MPDLDIQEILASMCQIEYFEPTQPGNWRIMQKTRIGENSFFISGGKLWSQAPKEIKEAENLSTAKSLIRSYCATLPI